MAAETLLAALVAVGLLASGSFLPVLGVFLSLLSPLPFVLLRLRHGLPALALALTLTALTLGGLSSGLHGIMFLVEFGLPATLLAEGLRRGSRPELLVTAVTALLSLGGMGALVLMSEEWTQPLTALRRHVEALLGDMEALTARIGLPGEGSFPMSGSPPKLRSFLLMAFPGLFFAGSLLTTSAYLGFLRFLTLRWPGVLSGLAAGPFRWQLPEPLVWVFIAGGVLSLTSFPWLQTLGVNLLIILVGLYFLQGLNIAAFLFQRFHLPRALAALSVFLLLFQPLLALLVAGLGLFDVWFAFRQLSIPRPPRQS
jgi:uncharacterized protein YybS (DUF2232 family)